MADPERICRECPEDQRYERRVMLGQESPNGQTWYLCIKHWLEWERWERDEHVAAKTVGVFPPVASGATVPALAPRPAAEPAKPKRSRASR